MKMERRGKYRGVGQFKAFLFLCAVIIIFGVMFFTQYLIKGLRMEARRALSMNIEHYSFLLESASPLRAFEEIQRIDIPIILTDADGNPKFWKNVDIATNDTTEAAKRKLQSMISRMDRTQEPIPLEYSEGQIDYFHYGDSNLIALLRLLPYLGIGAAGLFILIGYLGFKHIKDSEQRSVWIGMARETAHQLGTPLSSLLGWMELLKTGKTDDKLFAEMDKDISRLERITARFSQIGSKVKLQRVEIAPVVRESINYYLRRIPHSGKKIEIIEDFNTPVETSINPYLLGWVVENLIRNSIDAINGETGTIKISIRQNHDQVVIDVTDTGCGIDPSNRRNIFRPGYTTKSRGWGVGLSLARRIIQDYHGGRLFIKESHPGQGTIIRISLPLK